MEKVFKIGDKLVYSFEVEDMTGDYVYGNGFNFHKDSDNIKHVEKPFEPREMIVWDDNKYCTSKEKVIGMFNGRFIADIGGGDWYVYKNAKEIEEETEIISDEKLLKTFEGWLKQIKK